MITMERPQSMESQKEEKRKGLVQGALVVLLIVASFLIGSLYTKVQYLEKGGGRATTTVAGDTTGAAQAQPQAPAKPTVSLDQIKNIYKEAVVKFGDTNKKALFVEVADPSCPYCHVAAGKNPSLNSAIDKQSGRNQFTMVADGGTYVAPVEEMKKLVDAGKAAFVWLYTPGHGNGEMGTKAMYCAFEKGKFWEVHDLLMTSTGYDLLNNTIKNDKAKSQELADFLKPAFDATQMKNCLDSGKYEDQLSKDIKLASGVGVNATPGFFVNTTSFAGAYSWKDMESTVNEALGK